MRCPKNLKSCTVWRLAKAARPACWQAKNGCRLNERIIEEYGVWKTLLDDGMFADDDGTPYDCEPEDAAIKGDLWWNPKWIPLTADGGGNGKMIDMDPTESGTAGQIIQMWHDDAAREKIANSLREFLQNYVQDLEAGRYVLDADYGVILQSELDDLNAE